MHEAPDIYLTKFLLQRPRMCFSEAETLRDVLALIHGVALGRYPPHGSGFLPGFNDFVNKRFRSCGACYHTLLKEFGHKSMAVGCEAVLNLLEEWESGLG
jgi:hypothetical protein